MPSGPLGDVGGFRLIAWLRRLMSITGELPRAGQAGELVADINAGILARGVSGCLRAQA
jgi:hypothetical protein